MKRPTEAQGHLTDASNHSGSAAPAWGGKARALGWSDVDLFGVNPVKPHTRYDGMGLAFLIRGGEVTTMDADTATIVRGTATLTFRRTPNVRSVVVWDWMAA